jgi:hypothetical protein
MVTFERSVIEQELIVSPSGSVAEGSVKSAWIAVTGVVGAQARFDKTGGELERFKVPIFEVSPSAVVTV